jgi:hypothetical protein
VTRTIREMLLEERDEEDKSLSHSIERTMKSDTTRALFLAEKEQKCNTIRKDLDGRFANKFSNGNDNTGSETFQQ